MLVNTLNRCLFLLVRTFVNIAPVNPSGGMWSCTAGGNRENHGSSMAWSLSRSFWVCMDCDRLLPALPFSADPRGGARCYYRGSPALSWSNWPFGGWSVMPQANTTILWAIPVAVAGLTGSKKISSNLYHVNISRGHMFFRIYHQDIIHQLNIVITTN